MLDGNGLDFKTMDYRALTPAQWVAFKEGIIRDARLNRSKVLAALINRALHAIGAVTAASGAQIAAIWTGYAAWRVARSDFAALSALDDCTLKDIGIARSEIESIVRKPNDPTRHEHLKKAA